MKPTLEQLGQIIRDNYSDTDIFHGYNVDPTDLAEVGRQALRHGDINSDGTFN